jgi:hypothetical protein
MRIGIITALSIATIAAASFAAQAQTKSGPPTPRPAAGALPAPTTPTVQGTFRTQTTDEQRMSAQTTLEAGAVGRPRCPDGCR